MRYTNRYKIGTIPFVSGQRQTLEIPRTGVLHSLDIRVQFTITSGSSAIVGPLFECLARILSRLEIEVNGDDTVVNTTGAFLAAMQEFDNRGVPGLGMDDTVILTGSATATAYDINLHLPFYMQNGRGPDDTGLPTKGFRDVNLAVTWTDAACADLFTTPNGATISGVTCTVHGEFHNNVAATKSYYARGLALISEDLGSTSSDFAMELAANGSPLNFRRAFIQTLVGNIGSDAILSGGSIKLEATPVQMQKVDGVVIKAQNRRRYMLPALTTGLYVVDTQLFGEGPDMINVSQLDSDLKLIFDATKQSGTNRIIIQREVLRNYQTNQ